MPLFQVEYPSGSLSAPQKSALAEKLTHLLLLIEGGADTPGGRELSYVLFREVPAEDWYVGGSSGPQYVAPGGKFIINLTIPEASTTQSFKEDIHTKVNAALAEVLGWNSPQDGMSAWVMVREMPEGSWGANGQTYTLERIAKHAAVPADPLRRQFVQGYFTAKGTLYGKAGFPADTSGLYKPSTNA
ncbi:MAG: tautomerase family protein [Rhodoferax sp.]|nr:tautomerase family protein [Rhodoferax sp.]